MAPKFGTSGLRGLVTELSDTLIADYLRAFMSSCDVGARVFVGHDLRPSSPNMANIVADEIRASARECVFCGAVPTPALALAASGASAIMVTGSHIPADRNGLKFYTRVGEITKADEAAIVGALGRPRGQSAVGGQTNLTTAGRDFVQRYVSAFGVGALTGRRIGVYAHSAVGRDLLSDCLKELGATVIVLAPSDTFIPVDTEAVDPETRQMFADWVRDHALDAIASTDGDSDRPMLCDETGRVIPGDILGQVTAEALGAEVVVTPVSSNTGVLQKGFGQVIRTRIGSPFVIQAMERASGKAIGYEANGGTLLGFEAQAPTGSLSRLPTRDSFLPIIATLLAAGNGTLSERVAKEPPRFTAADRLQGIDPDVSRRFLDGLTGADQVAFLAFSGAEPVGEDHTDGLRLMLSDGAIVHLRPSGNAPEFRLYAEASDQARANDLLKNGLVALRESMDRLSR